ncbi:MAG TPA: CPBP family intramembrane glutamic endopeptidase [Pseudonocardia sp.]
MTVHTRPAGTQHPSPAHDRPVSAVRAWTVRRPLTAFLIIVFGLAYPLMAVPVLAVHRVIPGGGVVARLPVPPDEFAGLLLALGALLPAGLYVTWAVEGRPGVRRLVSRLVRWRVGTGWWLAVLLGLPVLTVGFALLLGDTARSADPVDLVVSQVGLLAANFALVNIWEEAAWAGVFQSRLERRHNVFVAALLTAVPFGFVHWPLAFFGDVTVGSAAVALLAYLTLGVIFRPMLGVFLRGTRDSVLLVALLHSVFNRTNNGNGIAAGLLDGDGRQVAVLVAAVVLTGVTALVLRRRLGRAERAALDALDPVRG